MAASECMEIFLGAYRFIEAAAKFILNNFVPLNAGRKKPREMKPFRRAFPISLYKRLYRHCILPEAH